MSVIKLMRFVKEWALVFSMITGATAYLIFNAIPALIPYRRPAMQAVHVIQPTLLFAMLFLSFCKVDPHKLRPHPMFLPMLAMQCIPFALLSLIPVIWPDTPIVYPVEAAMICMICPTATAASVVTMKLGGNIENVTSYLMLINLACALLIPIFIPLVNPHAEHTFLQSFFLIIGKVFPLLICPFLAALFIRRFFPRIHATLAATKNLVFNFWICNLSLAIAVTTRHIVHSHASPWVLLGIILASLGTCVFQFWFGRKVGLRTGYPISASQALGQKNTVFAIWMGYTFLDPITSVAGGFYSIWHNVHNARQLHHAAHHLKAPHKQEQTSRSPQ